MSKRQITMATLFAIMAFLALVYFALPGGNMDGMGGMNHGSMNMQGTMLGGGSEHKMVH